MVLYNKNTKADPDMGLGGAQRWVFALKNKTIKFYAQVYSNGEWCTFYDEPQRYIMQIHKMYLYN